MTNRLGGTLKRFLLRRTLITCSCVTVQVYHMIVSVHVATENEHLPKRSTQLVKYEI